MGSLEKLCNSFSRFNTLGKMGNQMTGIDTDPFIYGGLFERFHHHLNIGPGIRALNQKVVQSIEKNTPEILWVDNKPFLTKSTLKYIRDKWPEIRIINLITDDPTGNLKYAWRIGLKTAGLYDMHFVQRLVNIPELKKRGARRVEICYRSFDPGFHRPHSLNEEDYKKYKSEVGFIGTYERNREEFIIHLIKNRIKVIVTGNDWQNGKYWKLIKPFYHGPSVYGEPYIKTINGMDIALHFLRHANRDEQDSRTFEIPACGVFMLAERSKAHLELFKGNEEAVYFSTKEELLEKVKLYLSAPEERKRIARNGYKRCLSSGYDHKSRMEMILRTVSQIDLG